MLKPSQRDRLRKEHGRKARKGNNMDIVKVLMVAALFSAAFLFLAIAFSLTTIVILQYSLPEYDFKSMTDDGRRMKDFHLCIFALFVE